MSEEHLLINKQKRANKELQKKGEKQKVYNLLREEHEENISVASGEKYCICQQCGKEFEQDYRQDTNSYSNFKTCKSCRSKKARKIEESKELENQLNTVVIKYSPYPWQKKFHEDMKTHRFAVIAAGARAGKVTL
jgi:hypothetical protein